MFDYNRLLSELDLDLGLTGAEGSVRDMPYGTSLDTVRRVMLRNSFFKKLCPSGVPDESLVAAALEKFNATNDSLPSGDFDWPAENGEDATFWDFFRNHFDACVHSVPECWEFDFIADSLAVGPGAVVGGDALSSHNKLYASSLTYTDESLLALYRAACARSDVSFRAEKLRDEVFGSRQVLGNKLFFVNKNVTSLRTCASEPAINMLFQQAIRKGLEQCLRSYFGIDLAVQAEKNKRLAQEGSRTGGFATIDMTDASDRTGWGLTRRITRGALAGLLRMARSPSVVFPDGGVMTLRMTSTMGNAFTFPLMTIIYASAVRAVYDMMGLSPSRSDVRYGVFGDDIVLRSDAFDKVCRYLTMLGYRVNEAKSFAVGSFRESCGGDFFDGEPVRGVYIKTLEDDASVSSAFNRLARWSAYYHIPLPRVLRLLKDSLGGREKLVPPYESDTAGLHVPESVALSRGQLMRVDSSGVYAYSRWSPPTMDWTVPQSEDEFKVLRQRARGLTKGLYRFFNPYGLECLVLAGSAGRVDSPIILTPSGPDEPGTGGRVLPLKSGWRRPGGLDRLKVSRVRSHLWWDWHGSHEGRLPVSLVSREYWEILVAGIVS